MITSLKNLISDQDHDRIRKLLEIAPRLRNRWFAIGKDMAELVNILNELGKSEAKGGENATPNSGVGKLNHTHDRSGVEGGGKVLAKDTAGAKNNG